MSGFAAISNSPITLHLITKTQATDIGHAVTAGCTSLLLFLPVVLSFEAEELHVIPAEETL